MPELTEQDIADMKLDKLSPADEKRIILGTTEYNGVEVHGFYDRILNKFEVNEVVDLSKIPGAIMSEKVRSFIQDNYEDKLVEACL